MSISLSTTTHNKYQIIPLFLLIIIIIYGSLARWSVVNNTVVNGPIRADAADYFYYAKNISESLIYSRDKKNTGKEVKKDALRSPGFPFFASLFYQGENINSVTALLKAQTILQCLAFLTLSILCWWSFGAWNAVFMSLLLWTHPAFMSINSYYLTESLFLSSLIFLILFFALAIKSRLSLSFVIFLGISIGLSALIRPTIEYYLLFLLPLILFRYPHLARKLWPALAVFLVIIFSWKIRNYFAIGHFSDPHLMIHSLFHGSYPNFMYNGIPQSHGIPYRFDPQASHYAKELSGALTMIWQRAVEQPWQYLSWYIAGKQFYLWQWNILAGQGDVFIYPIISSPISYQADLMFWHKIHKLINAPIMFIGIAYSYYILLKYLIKKIPVDLKFIIASLVTFASLIHIVVAPYPRYGIPFKVLVIIIFVLFIHNLIHQSRTYLKNRKVSPQS